MIVDPCSKNIFYIDIIAESIIVMSPSGENKRTLLQDSSRDSNRSFGSLTQDLINR